MIRTAIILAGGLGTRLRGVVPDLPKPMVPINDRPFLEYQLDFWIKQGVTRFILSVGYLKDSIINHFGNFYNGASIQYVIESEPLGTGGGLLLAANNLEEAFLVINGDTYIDVDLDAFYQFHIKSKSTWTIALFSTKDFIRFLALDVSQNGQIKSLKPKKKISKGLANGGVYLIEPIALREISFNAGDSVSLESQILPNFISNGGKLFGQECFGKFIDIGLPRDYFRAKDILPQ